MSKKTKRFIGIDLGTSNSAIALHADGETEVRTDREGKKVAASAIYVGKRGTKTLGNAAYQKAAGDPEYGARLFKRLMGSDTKVPIRGLNEEWTPERCSAEILRELMTYVPAELQKDVEGIVVTVPAAFDQAQKNATLQAAEDAGIGTVTLLQEPIAALMAATQKHNPGAHLVVCDLGGGTLDVAVAEWTKRGIILHAHGGIQMCGGRDIDRALYEAVVQPWIEQTFTMEQGWEEAELWKRKGQKRGVCEYATEQAKIRLSGGDTTRITLEEAELKAHDSDEQDMYLEIDLDRTALDKAMAGIEARTVECVRETLKKGGFSTDMMDAVVFIGGPTQYQPLRERVCAALGLPGHVEADPMTAVALGAAIFAEGVDWESGTRQRTRKVRETARSTEGIEFELRHDERISTEDTKITITPKAGCEGATIELISEQTGWSSGEAEIGEAKRIQVRVSQMGENTFEAVLKRGTHSERRKSAVCITRTRATVEAVPLAKPIGIEVLKGRSKRTEMWWIGKEGDELPLTKTGTFYAGEQIRAGSPQTLRFKVLEGAHKEPHRNEMHGVFAITGTDIDEGVIEEGVELEASFTIGEGGQLKVSIKVPSVKQVFSGDKNYYRHEEGRLDYREAAGTIREAADDLKEEVQEAADVVDDRELRKALVLLEDVEHLDWEEDDPETVKEHHDRTKEARDLLAKAQERHKSMILQHRVAGIRKRWEDNAAAWADEGTKERVRKQLASAERAAGLKNNECEDALSDVESEIWKTLWKEDWFVFQMFDYAREMATHGRMGSQAAAVVAKGEHFKQRGDAERLRPVVGELMGMLPRREATLRWLEHTNVRAK